MLGVGNKIDIRWNLLREYESMTPRVIPRKELEILIHIALQDRQ